jgi:signal transduction histidine kinase
MAPTTPPHAVVGTPHRPYRRGVENAILGGVCGGLAIRLGVKERTVRIVFSLMALVGGLGLLLYMVLWLTRPRSGEDEAIGHRLLGRRRELHRVLIALIAIVACIFILFSLFAPNFGVFTWPLMLSVIGAIGVWRGASSDERHHLEELVKSAPLIGAPASRTRRALWLRVLLGVVLVFIGLRTLRHVRGFWGGTTPVLFGIIILVAGVLVLLAPWWLATLNDLSGERRARVRVEERANVAAHLHDSVLQTLTLIERAAGDETAVTRLARNQERELRQWLFEPERALDGDGGGTLTSQLHALESEIENNYGVKVELVAVGDCETNADVLALVAAGREAAINAARWSDATSISIFAEVEPQAITLFVRDRGKGFDVDAVPRDRQGIALSIRQRMLQHGGTASLKSALEVGTEVQLALPRKP